VPEGRMRGQDHRPPNICTLNEVGSEGQTGGASRTGCGSRRKVSEVIDGRSLPPGRTRSWVSRIVVGLRIVARTMAKADPGDRPRRPLILALSRHSNRLAMTESLVGSGCVPVEPLAVFNPGFAPFRRRVFPRLMPKVCGGVRRLPDRFLVGHHNPHPFQANLRALCVPREFFLRVSAGATGHPE
jgi:hypothetical protein